MFKRAQVLRINRNVNTISGESLPEGTRVVILKSEDNGQWRVKVQDPDLDKLRGARAVVRENVLEMTHRGRPRKNVEA